MSPRWYYRLSGLALLVGGLIMAFTVADLPIAHPLDFLIMLVGGGSLLLGLPALYARQAHQIGWIGLVGLAIIGLNIVAYPVQGGISGFLPVFRLPAVLFAAGPLTLVGAFLFGITTFRAQVLPRWLSWAPFLGWILSGVGNLLLAGLPGRLVGAPGEWLFWLSFAAFGYLLLAERPVLESVPASAAVTTVG